MYYEKSMIVVYLRQNLLALIFRQLPRQWHRHLNFAECLLAHNYRKQCQEALKRLKPFMPENVYLLCLLFNVDTKLQLYKVLHRKYHLQRQTWWKLYHKI